MARLDTRLVRQYHRSNIDSTLALSNRLLDGLGTPVSTGVSDAIRGGRWPEVFGTKIDPRAYSNSSDYRIDYLASSLFSKFPVQGFVSDAERKSKAIDKFLASEKACAETSVRLSSCRNGTLSNGVPASSYIYTMKKNICGFDGRPGLIPTFNWDDAAEYFGFGPGASTRLPRRMGDPYYKFQGIPEVTANCEALGSAAIMSSPLWRALNSSYSEFSLISPSQEVVIGNRITTVPKSAKIDRVIAIEPDMNMYVQKGIGGWIRKHLKRHGCNLDDQTPNQELARIGSLDGSLATIDLASASDSLAWSLCREVLPPDLISAIELCRSEKGTLPDGRVILYRKVSSMGNGFTFELQSLIFLSAIRAVAELHPEMGGSHRVYGDDIVCPTQMATVLIELLRYIGFETNIDKTFVDGPFRESCGKHYFLGDDVTPFYIRENIDTVQRLYWFHNQFILWLNLRSPDYPVILDDWESLLIDTAIEAIPPYFRSFGIPYGVPQDGSYLGSVGIFMRYDDVRCASNRALFPRSFKIVGTKGVVSTYADESYLCRQLYYLNKVRRLPIQEGGLPDVNIPSWNGVVRKTQTVINNKCTVFRWADPYVRL